MENFSGKKMNRWKYGAKMVDSLLGMKQWSILILKIEINSYNKLKDYEKKAVELDCSLTAVNLTRLIISLGLFSIMSMAAYDIHHKIWVSVTLLLLIHFTSIICSAWIFRICIEIRQSVFDMKKMLS